MTTDTVEEIRAEHESRRGSEKGQYRLSHAKVGVLLERIATLEATSSASDGAMKELIATRAALEAIEAHCVNERGLQGIDHADEGRRIRAGIQALLAAPSAITKATR